MMLGSETKKVWVETTPDGTKKFGYTGFVSLYEMFGWLSKECDPAELCDIAGEREQRALKEKERLASG